MARLTRFNELIENGETLKGSWELLPNHELGYRASGRSEEIRYRMPIIAAEPDALVAAWTAAQDDQTVVTRTVKLTGRWKTDGQNRLVFEIERSAGRPNTLTFKSTWKLNDGHDIVYSWGGRRGQRGTHELVFKGDWNIADRRHLIYSLGGDSDSAFRFRGAFQTPSILAKKGEMRFQVGAEASGRVRGRGGRKGTQTVTLFGAWKVGRDLALSFELDRPGSRRSVLRFGGEFRVGAAGTLTVSLRSQSGKPLGTELVVTREIFSGNGELFVRVARDAAEKRVEAGGRIRW